jgi:acid stress-induced BolA-like protein IbaG/YrbA
VDLKKKVAAALRGAAADARIRLEDDDGISGFVVSAEFRGMSALDRQMLIDGALRNSSLKFSKPELRQILAIAALTPAEYDTLEPKRRDSRR